MSRSQNFKSYGRGKHSNHPNTVVHTSIQFDKLFCENANKPTAAKSAGTVGKWGITSFTSIRSSTFSVGRKESRFSSLGKKKLQSSDDAVQAKRPACGIKINNKELSPLNQPRKFFKSRNSDTATHEKRRVNPNNVINIKKSYRNLRPHIDSTTTKNLNTFENELDLNQKSKELNSQEYEKPIKLSISKKSCLSVVQNNNDWQHEDDNCVPQISSTVSKERDKPPIVLRIFKGTSQLITDPAPKSASPKNEESSRSPIFNTEALEKMEIQNDDCNTNIDNQNSQENIVEDENVNTLHDDLSDEDEITNANMNIDCNSRGTPSPVITTRSLRRRPVTEPLLEPRTSPKRVLRNTRSSTATGKIVITNLHSDNPTVYTLSVSKPVVPTASKPMVPTVSKPVIPTVSKPVITTSPPPLIRKDSKENRLNKPAHRSHRLKGSSKNNSTKVDQNKQDTVNEQLKADESYQSSQQVPNNAEETIDNLKRAEDLLASSCIDFESTSKKLLDIPLFPNKVSRTKADTAELLRVLEDDTDAITDELCNLVTTEDKPSSDTDVPSCVTDGDESKLPVLCENKIPEVPKLKLTLKKSFNNYICKEFSSDILEQSLESTPKVESEPINTVIESNCDCKDSSKLVDDVPVDNDKPLSNEIDDCKSQIDVDSGIYEASNSCSLSSQEIDMKEDDVYYDENAAIGKDESSSTIAVATSVPVSSFPALKKGSIFKSRNAAGGNKNRLALYKHKWVDEKDTSAINQECNEVVLNKLEIADSVFDIDDYGVTMPLTKITKQVTDKFGGDDVVTSVRCPRKNKEFYTVVKNVKNAHQIQESGEFQEFNDDVEYILDALQDNNPIGTRCLSAITLATKCMEPAFRMHVRAHGTVTKFFKTLHDATKDQSLGMCTATVMFVLSQDRLNMDLDHGSLELMLNLLESDASHKNALDDCGLTDSQLTKTRDRVRQICADIQAQGHAKHLNLDNITVGHLAMETLLSLTSKRSGEWFKEELRDLGGLEHIIKTIVECCRHVDDTANAWSSASLDKIRKVDRCLRVLENVTTENEQNNVYMLKYQDGVLIDTLIRMYKVCDYEIPLYPTYIATDKESTGAILRECLIANLKVLINVTQTYSEKSYGSYTIGSKPAVIDSSLHVLLQLPQHIPNEEKFDLILLTLILLINLVEHCDTNRKLIIDAKAPSDDESIFETKSREPAVKALISMFYHYEELARTEEKKTDAILDGESTEKPQHAPQKSHEEFVEETVAMLLQKAGQHMEHTLIAAYVAVLIGYIISNSEEYEMFVRQHLPQKNFETMISVLQKFFSFMTLTASGGTGSTRGIKSTQMVIQKLIESDQKTSVSLSSVTNNDNNNISDAISCGSVLSTCGDNFLADSISTMMPNPISSSVKLNSIVINNT